VTARHEEHGPIHGPDDRNKDRRGQRLARFVSGSEHEALSRRDAELAAARSVDVRASGVAVNQACDLRCLLVVGTDAALRLD
jgi:hypothetical protein